MKKYVGLKLIQAKPINYYDFCIEKYNNFNESEYGINNKFKDGYLVKYEDGYISWSPKEVFEKAYKEVDIENFRIVD